MAGVNDQTIRLLVAAHSDMSGVRDAKRALESLKTISEQSSLRFDKDSKIITHSFNEIVKGGKKFTVLKGYVQDSKGEIQKFSFAWRGSADAVHKANGKFSDATGELKKLSKAADTGGINLGKLTTRAAATVLIWSALRNVMLSAVQLFQYSIKFFIEFEAQLAQVAIVGKNSAQSIKALGDESLKLAAKFGISFTQLGEALTTFAQQGFSAVEILDLIGPTLEFALVSGRRAGDVVEDLVAIQTSFNLEAKDTVAIYDSITAAQLKYSITTAQLAAGLRKLSPVAASLGLSLQETEGFLVAVQQQTRQSGEAVATALESIFGRLQSPEIIGKLQGLTKIPLFLDEMGEATTEFTSRVRPTVEVVALLSDAFERMGEADRAALNVILGGRTRFAEAAALLNTYNLSIEATTTSLFSFGATQKASATLLDTVKSNVAELNAEFLVLINTLKDPALSVLNTAISGGKFILSQLNDKGLGTVHHAADNVRDRINGTEREEDVSRAVAAAVKRSADERQAIDQLSESYLFLLQQEELFAKRIAAAKGTTNEVDIQREQAKFLKDQANNINSIADDPRLKGLNFPKVDGSSSQGITEPLGKFVFARNKGLSDEIAKRNELKNTQEREAEFLRKSKQIEIEGLKTGKSRIAIVREQLALLAQKDALGSAEAVQLRDRLEIELAEFELKKQDMALESGLAVSLQKAAQAGENDLQIQARKIAYARELYELRGDETLLIQEQLKLQEMIAARSAAIARELQNTFAGAFKSLLKGESDLDTFFTTIGDKMKDQVAESLSNVVTDKIFQSTGFGDIFGNLLGDFETQFSGIKDAHKDGSEVASELIYSSFERGGNTVAQQITNALNSGAATGGSGGQSNLPTSSSGANSIFGGNNPTGKVSDKQIDGIAQGVRKGIDNKPLAGSPAINTTGNAQTNSSLFSKLGIGGGGKGLGSLGGAAGFGLGALATINSAKKGDIGGAALNGAMAGSAFGPWGAVIGGVGSAVITALTTKKDPKQLDKGFLGTGAFTSFGEQTRNALGKNGIKGGLKSFYDPFGIFTLFKKRRRVDVEETTQDLQVASKIDITNKKLDFVNRNLIALKQTFETFILPESAAFAEKRNLEDNFSLNARRGLV